jgi:micrococcal nuclease
VSRVIDGDTIELESGERVRYLLVDTPESTSDVECWGPEAKEANRVLVEGQIVELEYDEECTDGYERLLAYVSLDGRLVNEVIIERGHGCVLHIPPNGEDRVEAMRAAEEHARQHRNGLWGACSNHPC